MALYTDTVMDHFMHPRNVGEIANPSGVGEVGNAKCGDIMKMYLDIENNVIKDVKFETFGCSVLAEEAIKSAVKDYYDRNGIPYDHSQFPDCESCESCRMV